MIRSAFITWVLLAAVFTAVNASGCYDYSTRAACVNQPCGYGSYKCYWARDYKRSADLPEGENPGLLEEAAAEAEDVAEEKTKRLAPLDPDDPYIRGYCDCCTRTCAPPKVLNKFACICTCPYPIPTCTGGRVFDYGTCTCKCPPNSYWDSSVSYCVGDCKWLSSTLCTKIRCNKNKHLFCQSSYGSCTCPSCPNVYDYSWCVKTKCTYNWTPCVWDAYYNKCKCSY